MRTIRTFLAIPIPDDMAATAMQWASEMKANPSSSDSASSHSSNDRKSPRETAGSRKSSRGGQHPAEHSNSDGLKWVPMDNLHLTLKFLGEVENVETPKVCEILEDVCEEFDPFELQFLGADLLPSEEKARVLTIGIDDPTDSLTKIVSQLEDRYADLGFKREPRDYRPHLTLARARGNNRRISPDVLERWQRRRDDRMGDLTVDSIQVIGSFLEKRGPTYNVMDTVWL